MGQYSKSQVDRAGNVLKDLDQYNAKDVEDAQAILTYWRYIHIPVINGFQAMLRNKISGKYRKNGFIAQRLKRTPSIISKLDRTTDMRLCRMNDIAGIRAVMKKLSDVELLYDDLINGRHKHKLVRPYNYIKEPKESGYRSIHLIFEYFNKDKIDSNGLKIEVQIRTQLQHTWATAVETLGTFLNISLKSGQGDPRILDFFALSSSAFAIIEKCPILNKHLHYPTAYHLFQDVIKAYDYLRIEDKLGAYSVAANEVGKIDKGKYFLIVLDTLYRNITITAYSKMQYAAANQDYTLTEMAIKQDSTKEAVLISIDKISALKKAYPNYFLDASNFVSKIEALRAMITKNKNSIHQLTLNFDNTRVV